MIKPGDVIANELMQDMRNKGKNEKKIISPEEVLRIRGGGNPDRAIAPNTHTRDLSNKSYSEIIEIFKDRIYDRYIYAADAFDKEKKYNFVVIILCCIIVDLLSQYWYGSPASKKFYFKEFFRENFKQYNHRIIPPIRSCYFDTNKDKWFEEIINDVADGFYHCFRCGVVHSAMILEYGRINERFPEEIIKVVTWGKDKNEININTSGFLRLVKEAFDSYCEKLRLEEQRLKNNFIKKWELDFGVQIKNELA